MTSCRSAKIYQRALRPCLRSLPDCPLTTLCCWQRLRRGCSRRESKLGLPPTGNFSCALLGDWADDPRPAESGRLGIQSYRPTLPRLAARVSGQQGFSPRNLKYMRAFAGAWPEAAWTSVQHRLPELQLRPRQLCKHPCTITVVPSPRLLDKLKTPSDRLGMRLRRRARLVA